MTPPCIVLLHALPLSASMWDAPRRVLDRHGYQTIAPDQRGFGGQPLGAEAPSLDVVADDVARLLDARRIDRAVIAGASMGGYVAMTFLRRHRERVAGLALLASRASADDDAARAVREQFAVLIQDEHARPGLLAATVPRLIGATARERRPELLSRLIADAGAAAPAAVAWAQRAIAARPDSFDVLRATGAPALVIAGREDELVGLDQAEATASALPRGRLIVIENAGHLPPLETPELVADALLALLRACFPRHDRAGVTA
jgi:pimeloyl-ACP methyl ester carboxylesterase